MTVRQSGACVPVTYVSPAVDIAAPAKVTKGAACQHLSRLRLQVVSVLCMLGPVLHSALRCCTCQGPGMLNEPQQALGKRHCCVILCASGGTNIGFCSRREQVGAAAATAEALWPYKGEGQSPGEANWKESRHASWLLHWQASIAPSESFGSTPIPCGSSMPAN